ncbi:MAG: GNAT family N-acetyltransferase [Winogradskyella sp.]|nr:GNAT family N-acetyltransferase [Winogradskyella sp.]
MTTLKGKLVFLRALENEDLQFLYDIENDQQVWELSNTMTPYSKYILQNYINNSHKDIFEVKQLRLVISDYHDNCIGLIDLFDFDAKNKRAGVGIIIKDVKDRKKGFAKEALNLLINYSFKTLQLHQLYCNISESNLNSIRLFENLNFERIGLQKDWNFNGKSFTNVYSYQLISKA